MRGRRHHGRDQVRLRPRHRDRAQDAPRGQGAGRERGGAGRDHLAGAPRLAAGIQRPARGLRRARHRRHDPRRRASRGSPAAVDAFCEGIGFTPDEVRRAVRGGEGRTASRSSSTPSSSATCTAPRWPPIMSALSADHLEHVDEAGVAAMARGRDGRGAAARRLLRAEGDEAAAGRSAAPLQRADGGGDRLQSRHLAGAVADLDDEHGLHPVRPDARGGAGRHDPRRARARSACRTRSARSAPARPPTSASGGSGGRPSFATGSACRGRSGGSSRGQTHSRHSSESWNPASLGQRDSSFRWNDDGGMVHLMRIRF